MLVHVRNTKTDSLEQPPNGVRYLRVGGRRERHFAETSLQPRKLPENAARPTRRVHAVLGRGCAKHLDLEKN